MRILKNHNFSLIELLISMSILLILLSLLNPAFNNLIQRTRKLDCQNNIKESLFVTFSIADHQNSILPASGYNNQGHYPMWIMEKVYNMFLDFGLNEGQLICPSLSARNIWGVNSEGNVHLIHNLYLGNNPSLIKEMDSTEEDKNYIIAETTLDSPESVLFADGNTFSSLGSGWTLAPHTTFEKRINEGYPIEPFVFGSDGGNIGYLDGSTRWKDYRELNKYIIHPTSNSYGMW